MKKSLDSDASPPRVPPVRRSGPPPLPKRAAPTVTKAHQPIKPTAKPRGALFRPWNRRKTNRALAAGTLALGLLCILPAVMQSPGSEWPIWATIIFCLGFLQAAYAAWLLTIVDWAPVRVVMVVGAVMATIHATAFMIAIAAPLDQVSPFNLDGVRAASMWWCPLMIVLNGALSFACGRISHRWRYASTAYTE